MHHIIFTSLPKTLTGGSGYGIAAATPDCPRLAMEEVTKLAGYSEIYPATHPSKDQNPVNYFFVKQSGFHILGRLSVAPNDYSGRSNYLGQFFILGPDYLPDCGPAALLKALPFIDRFEGEAMYLPAASLPNLPNAAPAICASWQRLTGDAGWAGVVADQIQSGSQVNILYGQPCRGLESLNLLADIFSLLPKSSKWQTTFSTHVEGFPKGTATKIRMLQEGDRKTQDFQKQPHLFDLTKKGWGLATDSPLVNQARTGIAQEPVLKIQPQAPAWPQKQFTAPLQPDLDIGNDQDWYTIQPETLETKGKNPQKIHAQSVPPPVQGKKPKLETAKAAPTSTYQGEKHVSKGTSWLLVLAFLFLGLLLGGSGGFAGGYWFRSGNEEALSAEKAILASDKATLEKEKNDLSNQNATLEKEKNDLSNQNDQIIKQSQQLEIDLESTSTNSVILHAALSETETNYDNLVKQLFDPKNEMEKSGEKNPQTNLMPKIDSPNNGEAEKTYKSLADLNKLTFVGHSFFKLLPSKDIPEPFTKSIKDNSSKIDSFGEKITNPADLKLIKESFFILQINDWNFSEKELKEASNTRPIIDPCNAKDDFEIITKIKDLSNKDLPAKNDEGKIRHIEKLIFISERAKDGSLFFGIQKNNNFGKVPSFKIIHVNNILASLTLIENTFNDLEGFYKSKIGEIKLFTEDNLMNIKSFLQLFKLIKEYKDSLTTKG